MSTTTALRLPRSTEQQVTPNRKSLYRPGVENRTLVNIEGTETPTFTSFDRARLIRLSARPQEAGSQAKGTLRKMIVVSMGIILDGLDVSKLEGGENVPHPLLSDPRFENFKSLPHRINAQQWMEVDDLPHVVNLANHLRNANSFRIQLKPDLPKNSNRKTRDLFVARPLHSMDPNNPTDFGVELDSFEVSVNPEYPQGFSSFYEGLTEQQERWVDVINEEDEDLRKQYEENLSQNMHFVGGAFFDEKNSQWWPRPVDIGIVGVNGQNFPLYPVTGDNLDADDLLSEIMSETEKNKVATDVTAGPEGLSDSDEAGADVTDW